MILFNAIKGGNIRKRLFKAKKLCKTQIKIRTESRKNKHSFLIL